MIEKIWECKIGVTENEKLPNGADAPMRKAVRQAFMEVTGVEDAYCFSGWGAKLTPVEKATVEGTVAPGNYAEFVWRGNFTENERDAQFLAGLGLMGEAAEILALTERCVAEHMAASALAVRAGNVGDYLKKVLIHGKELDRDHLVEELGDVLWYFQHTCNTFGITVEEVKEGNIAKLCDRYPDRYGEAEEWGVGTEN